MEELFGLVINRFYSLICFPFTLFPSTKIPYKYDLQYVQGPENFQCSTSPQLLQYMGLCQNAEKGRGIPIRTLTPRDVPFILHGTTMITEGEEKLGTGVWHSRVRPESNHNSVTEVN